MSATYFGAGLSVTFQEPADWHSVRPPVGYHYGATLADMSNFSVQQYCHWATTSYVCRPTTSTYPPRGMVFSLSVKVASPAGPVDPAQILASGARTTVGDYPAVTREYGGQGCQVSGAQHGLTYIAIYQNSTAAALYKAWAVELSFCWVGDEAAGRDIATGLTQTLVIHVDPSRRGQMPD